MGFGALSECDNVILYIGTIDLSYAIFAIIPATKYARSFIILLCVVTGRVVTGRVVTGRVVTGWQVPSTHETTWGKGAAQLSISEQLSNWGIGKHWFCILSTWVLLNGKYKSSKSLGISEVAPAPSDCCLNVLNVPPVCSLSTDTKLKNGFNH